MAFDVTRQELLKQANDLLRLFQQTRDKKYKDEEIRLRRIVTELEATDISGSQSLDDLTDVAISAPANAQVLTYNSTTSQWENQTPGGGGGGGDMYKSTYDVDNSGIVDKAEALMTIGRNSTGATLYKGTIVRIQGSTGNRPNFVKAQGNNDANSAQTFGVVVTNMPNNTDGYVLVQGTIHDLDTRSGATHPFTDVTLADGDLLYLHPTIAGYVTNIKPLAPQHLVYVGVVTRTSPTNGTIVYRVQNGYELYELHDVSINSPTDGQVLKFNAALNLWQNASGANFLYTKTIVAYRTTNQPSGTTMNLSTNGTGVSGLIGPTTANATWNVTIDTIATVIGITGDVTGVVIGDTYSETTRLVFKKVSGISTLVAIVSSEAGFDSSMTTALMNYSVGGTQNLNLQFQFPTFVGTGLIQINAISKLEIVEVTY
jgi:hypothetical protein